MKNLIIRKLPLIVLFLSLSVGITMAQERTHNGFYLSMAPGIAFGTITGKSGSDTYKITGSGGAFDFQIGFAIRENVILHAIMGSKIISGPTINDVEVDDEYSFNETIFGGGLTYYMKNNFFLTGNIGSGKFSIEAGDLSSSTDKGFSYQLKAGKEWWVSNRWGLGVVLEYGATSLKDQYNGQEDEWKSSRYSVRFIATFQGNRRTASK